MEKQITHNLRILLKDKIDDIDPHLRISTSTETSLIAFGKEFRCFDNYPKGHGEVFCTCME